MIIIITSESDYPQESAWIKDLFEEGLELLHVRKPSFSEQQMRAFIAAIPSAYRTRLVLHSHHNLASDFGINRLHVPELLRETWIFSVDHLYTTSVHDVDRLQELDAWWSYAFLSPIFPSISKPRYASTDNLLESKRQVPVLNTRCIALGGVQDQRIAQLSDFDGVALLGAIWASDHPVQAYQRCKQQWRIAKMNTNLKQQSNDE